MSRRRSTPADATDRRPTPGTRGRPVAALLAVLLALAGCAGRTDTEPPTNAAPAPGTNLTPAEVRAAEQRVLDVRARAVRTRNLTLFLRHVDRSDAELVSRQRRYFRNLVQLPLAEFGYRVTAREWPGEARTPGGRAVHVPEVVHTVQLDGFDRVPVRRVVGFAFSFDRGRAVIESERSAGGDLLLRGTPAPWDLTAVTVSTAPGVLGIFDRRTRARAETVTAAVRDGIEELERALPFDWAGRVVVYSVANPRVLRSFRDVPGGAIDHLGAMTFPTYAESERTRVASTRMLLMPSSVAAGQPFLGRITRHELSHVAIGTRDDGSPVWVSEGIAEYLGAREVPASDRIIPTAAVDRARQPVAGLPDSPGFNGADQEWHYALSWMACDYVAETLGEDRLWELVAAMHNDGAGTDDGAQDRVLRQVLGFDGAELARRAAARIRDIYG